jgi:mono/diheme cytochrome c family protein
MSAIPFAVLFAFLVVLPAGCATADQRRLANDGQKVFMAQGCHGCHTVGKMGTPIATDLTHVGKKYSETYLRSWLAGPAVQKPTAHMPKLSLTEAEIKALAAYLASLR